MIESTIDGLDPREHPRDFLRIEFDRSSLKGRFHIVLSTRYRGPLGDALAKHFVNEEAMKLVFYFHQSKCKLKES